MQITQFQALIDTIEDGGRNTALEVRTILTALKNEVFKLNEFKTIFMSPAEIVLNFNSTGLGINNSLGFAICNGQNGTQDYRRKTFIGYDSAPFVSGFDYSVAGNSFGSADAVVVAHTHEIGYRQTDLAGASDGSLQQEIEAATFGTRTPTTSTGVSGTDKNIQPSKVTLIIQRVS